jgi:hypothetical protein
MQADTTELIVMPIKDRPYHPRAGRTTRADEPKMKAVEADNTMALTARTWA